MDGNFYLQHGRNPRHTANPKYNSDGIFRHDDVGGNRARFNRRGALFRHGLGLGKVFIIPNQKTITPNSILDVKQ